MSELMAKAKDMINDFISERGVDPSSVYDETKKMWRVKRGSANIDIMLLEIPVGNNQIREFLQAASPIINVPKGKEMQFYRRLLELNDVKLGVKLSMQKDSEQVWALTERDLIGMDYSEMQTVLEDIGFWADEFDDILNKEFF